MKIPGLREETPNDGGQYGLTLLAVFPYANGIKAALHYIRYHSRLPLINGLTGDALAVAGTSPPAVAARAAQLQPVYESQGLSPEDAAMAALDAAEQLTLSGYANQSGYFVEYPEDIEMFAFTFNTATPRTGTLFSGEIAHHLDYPFQVSLNTVLNAVLSPVLYDPEIGDTVLGEFGPDEIVPGVVELDRTQISLEIGQVFGPRLGAAQTVLTGDLAWVHLHDMPSNNDLPLQAPGGADGDSWGYKLSAALQYSGIFGELNLTPRIIWTHDVKGTTPAPLSTFVEDRKSFSIGVFGTYVTRWSADLSYTAFFGGGRDNLLNDRDFIRFQLTYSF